MDHLESSISIHQPNYFPWLGYFLKIYTSDIFVFHDDVPFSKQSFTKRYQIRKELNQIDKQWLGIPVKSKEGQLISDIEIDHSSLKINKQILKLEYLYKKAPFFESYFPQVSNLLSSIESFTSLSKFNISTIKSICSLLEIETTFYQSSKLDFSANKHDYNIKIIKHFNANIYFSGMGATEYQKEKDFLEQNITLKYLNPIEYLKNNPYPQYQGEFIPGLSIIDTLFNIGKDGIILLFENMLNRKK